MTDTIIIKMLNIGACNWSTPSIHADAVIKLVNQIIYSCECFCGNRVCYVFERMIQEFLVFTLCSIRLDI